MATVITPGDSRQKIFYENARAKFEALLVEIDSGLKHVELIGVVPLETYDDDWQGVKYIQSLFTSFFERIIGNQTIENLNISRNFCLGINANNFWQTDTSIAPFEALAKFIKSSRVQKIDLHEIGLQTKHVKILSAALKENNSVNHLIFADNRNISAGFDELIRNAKYLTQLDLSVHVLGAIPWTNFSAHINYAHRKLFWQALKQNKTITDLNLSSNTLSPWDFEQLKNVLIHNSTLLKLNIWNHEYSVGGRHYNYCHSNNYRIFEALKGMNGVPPNRTLYALEYDKSDHLDWNNGGNLEKDGIDPMLSRNYELAHSDFQKRIAFVYGLYEEQFSKGAQLDKKKPLHSYRTNSAFDRRTVNIIFLFAGISAKPAQELDVGKQELDMGKILEETSSSKSKKTGEKSRVRI